MGMPAKPALRPELFRGWAAQASRSSVEDPQVPEFTAQQKTEIVLASLRGPKTMTELCREHDIADSLLRKWREQWRGAGVRPLLEQWSPTY